MTDSAFELALAIAALGYGLSVLLIGWRGLIGPNSLDRLVALDALVSIVQGGLAVYMVWTADTSVAYAMVAVALLGYLSSVSVARFRTPDARRPAADGSGAGGGSVVGAAAGSGGAGAGGASGVATGATADGSAAGGSAAGRAAAAGAGGGAAGDVARTAEAVRPRESDEADRTGLWKQDAGVRMPTKEDARKSELRKEGRK